jgi:outer membrane protein TolC
MRIPVPASVLTAFLAAIPAAHARSITLDEAIRIALERNPGQEASRFAAEAAGATRREAEAARLPRLLADAGWRRTDQQVIVFGDKLTAAEFTAADFAIDRLNHPDAADHAGAGIGIEWPVFTSGRIRAGIAGARAAEEAARGATRAAAHDLILGVTEAYHGVTLARSAVEVTEGALENARGHEAAAASRVEAGSALRSDLLRARVERLARERERERARADLDTARAGLRRILGIAPPDEVEPSEPLLDPAEPPEALALLAEGAAGTRPEVTAARREADAARAAAEGARAALGPRAALTARYDRNAAGLETGEGSFLVALGVRWDLLDRGRAARIAAAEARAAAAAARARAVEDDVRLEVEAAWHDLRVADHDRDAAREAVEAAAEARRIDADRYASGLLPLTDLLDAETALLRARLAEIASRYAAVVGRVRLARAAGLLEAPR